MAQPSPEQSLHAISSLSIVSVLVGTALAVSSLPEDTTTAGQIRNPALIMSAGALAGAVLAFLKGGFPQLLRVEWAVSFGMVYFVLLDVIQGLYPLEVSREAVVDVFLAMGLFLATMFAATMIKPPALPALVLQAATKRFSSGTLVRSIVICFTFGVFYYFFMAGFDPEVMINALMTSRFAAPWSRSSMGGWYAFIEHLCYFGYLLPTLTVMQGVTDRTFFSTRILLGLLCSCVFMVFVLHGGGRRIFGVCAGGALFTWLCAERARIRPKHLITLAVAAVLMLITMDFMLSNRSQGAVEFSYSLDQFQNVRVDDNFLRFAQNMEFVPRYQPHVGFQWVIYVLARPVPRVLWPGKPLTPGFDLASTIGVTASLSCSSASEWYVAFGWLGVVVGGILYGWLARFWSQLLNESIPLGGVAVYAMGMMAVVVSLRSMFELILMSYPLWAWLVFCKLLPDRQPAGGLVQRAPGFGY